MRNILYFATFLLVTPITLATTLFAATVLAKAGSERQLSDTRIIPQYRPFLQSGARLYAAIPQNSGKVAGVATASDGRLAIISQYLEQYNSPLLPHAQDLLNASKKYNLDFRLLVAIAQQESNLCKKIPANSFNCWGWGVHSRGTLRFESYSDGIEAVAKGLREDYLNKGYTTPEEIMKKYTPLSPGTWAAGIKQFLEEME